MGYETEVERNPKGKTQCTRVRASRWESLRIRLYCCTSDQSHHSANRTNVVLHKWNMNVSNHRCGRSIPTRNIREWRSNLLQSAGWYGRVLERAHRLCFSCKYLCMEPSKLVDASIKSWLRRTVTEAIKGLQQTTHSSF